MYSETFVLETIEFVVRELVLVGDDEQRVRSCSSIEELDSVVRDLGYGLEIKGYVRVES